MKYPPAGSTPGTLHYIPDNIAAFEPGTSLAQSSQTNTLIWIGGLFDTLMSVSYPLKITATLPPTWSLLTTSLGSAGGNWGAASIAQDAADMAKVVSYIKTLRPNGKIVLMGHSTGCQDCIEYLIGAHAQQRPPVDGAILQAPVSDREMLDDALPTAMKQAADQCALKMCRDGHGDDAMPLDLTRHLFAKTLLSARRWADISSPGPGHAGADDLFSSDLSDDRLKSTFGKLPASTPLLILHSGDDEYVAKYVDKLGIIGRWKAAIRAGGGVMDGVNSGVVLGASHNLNESSAEVVQDLGRRVAAFLELIDGGKLT